MNTPRRNTQRGRILIAYYARPYGMTDEEAGQASGVHQAWKRCSDLRADHLIAPRKDGLTRTSQAGKEQQVCVITEAGCAAVRRMS